MNFLKATSRYEEWLATELTIVQPDLKLKHDVMAAELFPFFRATYYRWAQIWPEVCGDLADAPQVLAVGDLHVENFGTWRDAEGRLIWGVNDFDETWPLAYTNDLVRLAAGAQMAIATNHLAIAMQDATHAILEGYGEWLTRGGLPFVLAEYHDALREMAVHRLKEVHTFWEKLDGLLAVHGKLPAGAAKAINRMLPHPDLTCRHVHRVAGIGSLGRQRFVALAEWHGGKVAREAKAMAPSACWWAAGEKGSARLRYQEILDTAVRCVDPYVKLKSAWIVRRLAPDCSSIELAALPRDRDELRLLRAMGAETANIHLAGRDARVILRDLKRRGDKWLASAAGEMVRAVTRDWEEWRKAYVPAGRSNRRGKESA